MKKRGQKADIFYDEMEDGEKENEEKGECAEWLADVILGRHWPIWR